MNVSKTVTASDKIKVNDSGMTTEDKVKVKKLRAEFVKSIVAAINLLMKDMSKMFDDPESSFFDNPAKSLFNITYLNEHGSLNALTFLWGFLNIDSKSSFGVYFYYFINSCSSIWNDENKDCEKATK